MINTTIGKYKITRKVGEGGMASVFEAEHETLGTTVAIKVLNPILSANAQIRERFRNEAKLMASLNHPNITKVIDLYEQPQQLAIIMEYLEGEDLGCKINRRGNLADNEIREMFSQILSAFQYAHEKGIVHRDIKPSNIYILPNGVVKILDFGIAKLFGQGNENTQTGTQMGTPIYMSPEQVKSDKSIDFRSDIYSLGVTMFYAINGRPPYDFATQSHFDIFTKIVHEPLPDFIVHSVYKDSVLKACKKNREERYQSCNEWFTQINALSANAKPFLQPSDQPINKPKKNSILTIAGVCIGILLAFAFVFKSFFGKEGENRLEQLAVTDSVSVNADPSISDVNSDENQNKVFKEEDLPKKEETQTPDKSEEYRRVLVNYYNDLTNDNYNNLYAYYCDKVYFMNEYTPTPKEDLIKAHISYHEKYPYHLYEVVDVKKDNNEPNIQSYIVILKALVKKTEYDNFSTATLIDQFVFDQNDRISKVIIKNKAKK